MRNYALLISPLALATGCAVPTPGADFVTRAEMDAALAYYEVRLESAETALADCLPRDEATVYLEKAEASGTYATLTNVAEIEGRVSFVEGDYASQGDLTQEIADREAGDNALLAIFGDYTTTAELGAILLNYALYTDAEFLADTALASAEVYADGLFALAEGEIDAIEGDVAELDGETVHIIDGGGTVTWNIDAAGTGDYPTIEDAIDALDGYSIASDTTLEIKLAVGDYYPTQALTFHHPNGGRIRLVGDEADAALIQLHFDYGTSGIVVDEGSTLGYLGGMTLTGNGTDSMYGVDVVDNSSVVLGRLIIEGWFHGILAWRGSLVGADDDLLYYDGAWQAPVGWLTVTDSRSHGVVTMYSSSAFLPDLATSGNASVGMYTGWASLGYAPGFVATSDGGGAYSQNGSFADVRGAAITSHDGNGIVATAHSGVDALQAVVSGGASGATENFLADNHSFIYAHEAQASGAGSGFKSSGVSYLAAQGSDVTGLTAPSQYYFAEANAFIYARDAVVPADTDVTNTDQNDTIGFIYGL